MNGEHRNWIALRALFVVVGLAIAGALSAQEREASVGILRSISANWDAAALDAWINEQGAEDIPVGDKIEFHFRSAAVGYMSLAYIDSAGAAAVVVPSSDGAPELTVAGEEQVYPSPAAGFQFRAVAPAGTETAFIILTDRPIRPARIGQADEYGFLESDNAADLLQRYVAAVNEVSEQGLVAVVEIEHVSVLPSPTSATTASVAPSPGIESDDVTAASVGDSSPGVTEGGSIAAETGVASESVVPDTSGAVSGPVADGTVASSSEIANADGAEAAGQEGATGTVDESTGGENVGEVIAAATELPEVPDVPELPEVPDVPEVPDAGDIADATGISDVNEAVAEATEVPDVSVDLDLPDVPDAADIEDATGVTAIEEGVDAATELPSLPDTPTMPTTDEVLTAAGVPDVPDVPDVAGAIPDVPDATDVVRIPDAPQVPDATDIIDIPDVPDVPSGADVVNLPDIPDVPDVPDVKGNALGRVMSQAQSVPTSSAEVKQIATAAAARKVFDWTFGGGGTSQPAEGEPIGVAGVIASLSADPEKMDALAEENPGAVGAIRLLSRSSDPDRQLALTLSDLEEEIENASEVYYCTGVSDCGAISLGRNHCGHPQKYVVYASTTTDVAELKTKARDYDSYDTVRRMAEGTPETGCSGEVQTPQLICERNICDIYGDFE